MSKNIAKFQFIFFASTESRGNPFFNCFTERADKTPITLQSNWWLMLLSPDFFYLSLVWSIFSEMFLSVDMF